MEASKVIHAIYNDDDVLMNAVKKVKAAKHHIEEIMWREKVSRKAIFSVLANYGDVLVTVKQPENNYLLNTR